MSNFSREQSAMAPKPPDCRSGDLVSRLLAATPPYLYNIPMAPQNFFFSEMLRGFVHARTIAPKENIIGLTPPHPRRGRKRSWKESVPLPKNNEPLELTNKTPPPKQPSPSPMLPPPPLAAPNLMPMQPPIPQDMPPLQPRMPPDLMMNPLWFPHLYPPIPPQFDPLNFLMDLRMNNNVWDGKTAPESVKETAAEEPLNLQIDDKKAETSLGFLFTKQRQSSAFRVPQPRQIFDEQIKKSEKSKSTNYILQNLQSIYTGIKKEEEKIGTLERNGCDKESEEPEAGTSPKGVSGSEEETTEHGEKKCKDLRALIGLELVVDYVKKGENTKARSVEEKCEGQRETYYEKDEQENELSLSDSTDETFSNHSSISPTQAVIQPAANPYLS